MPAIGGLNLGALLAEMAEREEVPRLDPEVALARLLEVAPAYTRENPFVVGNIVTPRADSCEQNAGAPHVVVAVRAVDFDFGHGQLGTNNFGTKQDIRVIAYSGPHVAAHWGESADFEFWVKPAT